MRKYILVLSLLCNLMVYAQQSSNEDVLTNNGSKEANINNHSSKDARLFRPAAVEINRDNSHFRLGGFADFNSQYFVTDGGGEGLHFQARGINLFFQSTFYNNRLSTIFNLAYDPILNQFNIDEAALNIKFNTALNLRGGIILPPLGYFNQNGDATLTSFIDRPLVSTTIIPSRFSEVGFGLTGLIQISSDFFLTYEAYAVNGLQNGITNNNLPRTAIDLGKPDHPFAADNNNRLSFTARTALKFQEIIELGFSYYGGQYNTSEEDEVEIDDPRNVSLFVLDAQFMISALSIKAEGVLGKIDVYEGLGKIYGDKQNGYSIEAMFPILKNINMLGRRDNSFNLAVRYEFVDYNQGNFKQTDSNIFDEKMGFRGGLSLNMGRKTSLKANYSYFKNKDILGNPSKTGGIQFGFATYF